MSPDLPAPGDVGPATHEDTERWLRVLMGPDQVVELRALRCDGGADSGFFDAGHLAEMARLGLEFSGSGRYKGVYFVLNPVAPALLGRSPYCVRGGGRVTRDADVVRRRWLLVDVDPQRPAGVSATDAEKAAAKRKAAQVREYLAAQGWPAPVSADSGNGYHLLYRVDLPPDDGGLVRGALRALAARFDDNTATVDTSVFNPARLTKLYGTVSRKGAATPERPHRPSRVLEFPDDLAVVSADLLRRLAGPAPAAAAGDVAAPRGVGGGAPVVPLAEKLRLAEKYLARTPPAVEGKGGDRKTCAVAILLVRDFDLTVEQALPLLLKYNERCEPPWGEPELRRKLEYADGRPGARGCRLSMAHKAQAEGPPPSARPHAPGRGAFLGAVPDFFMWDAELARPTPPLTEASGPPDKRGPILTAEWVRDILRFFLVQQRRLTVVIPDVFIGQLIWGPRDHPLAWPRNWRRTLLPPSPPGAGDPDLSREEKARRTREARRKEEPSVFRACEEGCPLHGRDDVPHCHFRGRLKDEFLGVMAQFKVESDDGQTVFDFHNKLTRQEFEERRASLKQEIKAREDFLPQYCELNPDEADDAEAELRQYKVEYTTLRPNARKVRGAWAVYAPVRIFGPSPRSKLTGRQCDLLSALTMETTRTSGASGRADRAQVVSKGRAPGPRERRAPVCPLLGEGAYVSFCGNGTRRSPSLHGHGFRLATWLKKAGYPGGAGPLPLLTDLARLGGPFGLVAAGWNGTTREWKPLDELLALGRSPAGRKWLDRCVLRVYTGADYLARWRGYFADKLGFSSIPGGEEAAAPIGEDGPDRTVSVRTSVDLGLWMKKRGLTDAQLAGRLGAHRTTINHYRTGRRRWRSSFQAKLDAYLAADKA
jgi:hypothetical protein